MKCPFGKGILVIPLRGNLFALAGCIIMKKYFSLGTFYDIIQKVLERQEE